MVETLKSALIAARIPLSLVHNVSYSGITDGGAIVDGLVHRTTRLPLHVSGNTGSESVQFVENARNYNSKIRSSVH